MRATSWPSWGEGGRGAVESEHGFLLFPGEVPGDGLLQAVEAVDLGLVAQLLGRATDVGQRVADVACARRAVDGLGGEAELACDGGVDLVERVALSGADVEDAACGDGAGRGRGQQVGAD